ncbi:type III pantothenate kinase [Bacteroidetes bacterium endosymbiont of Geopemphigus sp.]|uniref:type III pantothenate kinase n=1 Tax=Bacteroidetes bacterium endosymbiont of Geopemphigus sp. TaxID=2047937 RepID=UPI000CD0966A|nr:type III pantothenate kinase [Bacteroidetes bacterium endosymbiont of Geopemphigus sp.]
MLLVVNIGNSSLRFGVFEDESLECQNSWIINSKTSRSSDEYAILFESLYRRYGIDWKKIKAIVIGSVVPALTDFISNSLTSMHNFTPLVVNRYSESPVRHYSHQLGTDLYANAVAAYKLYNKTSLIVDFGTALSLTCVDSNAQFKGVIIAPGVNSSLGSLIQDTANLSGVELKKPAHVLGLHTEICIQSGMIHGYLSMVEGLIERINSELGEKCHVIATGGMAHLYEPLTKKIHQIDKLHTLKGLALLARFSKGTIKKYN